MNDIKHPFSKYVTLLTFLLALLSFIAFAFLMTSQFFLALATAGVLVLVTNSFFEKIAVRVGWPKSIALFFTLGIVLLILVPLVMFLGVASEQAVTISKTISENNSFSPENIILFVGHWPVVKAIGFTPSSFSIQVYEWIKTLTKIGSSMVFDTASHLPEIALQIVITSISYYFILLDGKRFVKWIGERAPFDRDAGAKVVSSLMDTAAGSVWATFAAAFSQALVLFFAYLFLGVPAPFLAAGAAFIFAWLPILGCVPVWVVGSVYLYYDGSISKSIIMVCIGLFSGVIDNIVRPLVLRGRSNMHPLVSLLSSLGGIGYFGIVGVFIGPVLVAVLIALLQAWPDLAVRFGVMPDSKSPES